MKEIIYNCQIAETIGLVLFVLLYCSISLFVIYKKEQKRKTKISATKFNDLFYYLFG